MRSLLFAIMMFAALSAFGRRAEAHQVGLSRGEYVLRGAQLDMELGFADRDVATAVPALDANGDGQLSADELERGTKIVDREITGRVRVRSGGDECSVELMHASIEGEDAVLRARATCPGGGRDLDLELGFLAKLPAGHRHLAHLQAGTADREVVAVHASPRLSVAMDVPLPRSPMSAVAVLRASVPTFVLAFACIVVLRRRPRPASTRS